jgi:hypothetical protein
MQNTYFHLKINTRKQLEFIRNHGLHFASAIGNKTMVQELLRLGLSANQSDSVSKSLFFFLLLVTYKSHLQQELWRDPSALCSKAGKR